MKLRSVLLATLALGSSAAVLACEDTSPNDGTPDAGQIGLDAGPTGTTDGSAIDSGATDSGPVVSRCPTPTGEPTKHDDTITADETWAAGVHEVTFDIGVRQGATLTLAPCAVVRIVADRGISIGTGNVGDGGKLVARGAADQPIVIEGNDTGRWSHLLVSSQGSVDLAYTTIKHGGGTYSRGGGALHLNGDQYLPIQRLAKVDHVTIEGSGKYGAVLEARGAFSDDSRDLVIAGSGDTAMRVTAPAAGTIPTGRYTGNTIDAIRLMGSGGYELLDADVTIRDRGVPYVVGGEGSFSQLSVQGADGTAPVLTVEAGVVMKFLKGDSGLFIDRASSTNAARGVLRALGTAEKPIVFTSGEATAAPGDWVGIVFRGIPSAQAKIDHVRVEYAGGNTGTRGFSCGTPLSSDQPSNEAAIAIFGPPASAFVTNTTIANSAANAIERAWTGDPLDFRATNTFTNVAWCHQTFPRPTTGSCPEPAPCDR